MVFVSGTGGAEVVVGYSGNPRTITPRKGLRRLNEGFVQSQREYANRKGLCVFPLCGSMRPQSNPAATIGPLSQLPDPAWGEPDNGGVAYWGLT